MLEQRSFAEIFDQKLDENIESPLFQNTENSCSTNLNAGWETNLDPAWMTQIMSELREPFTFSNQRKHNIYIKQSCKKAFIKPEHNMNEEQIVAFHVLQSYVPTFGKNFGKAELKSTYRQSLLKAHPDQGGNAERFHSVKKSYEILLPLVTK